MKSFDEMVTEAVERVIPGIVNISDGGIFEGEIRGIDIKTDFAMEMENKHKAGDKVIMDFFLDKRKCSLKLSLGKRRPCEFHNRMPNERRGVKCPN